MIEGEKYIEVVKMYFKFLITELGYRISNQNIWGNAFYNLEYSEENHIVSVSYENIEDYLQIIVFKLQYGKRPDYDNKSKTLHLNRLNAQIMPIIDRNAFSSNNAYFANCKPKTRIEKQLLKSAKELRLCLKHMKEIY